MFRGSLDHPSLEELPNGLDIRQAYNHVFREI
jgi:hypothetical protein